MKNFLKFLPSWKFIKSFLDFIFFICFSFIFITKLILISFFNHVASTNDIYLALMFTIVLFITHIDIVLNNREKY